MSNSEKTSKLRTVFFQNVGENFGRGVPGNSEYASRKQPLMLKNINEVLDSKKALRFYRITVPKNLNMFRVKFANKNYDELKFPNGTQPLFYRGHTDKHILEVAYLPPYKKIKKYNSYETNLYVHIFNKKSGYNKSGMLRLQLAPNIAPMVKLTSEVNGRSIPFIDTSHKNAKEIKENLRTLIARISSKLPADKWKESCEEDFTFLSNGTIFVKPAPAP